MYDWNYRILPSDFEGGTDFVGLPTWKIKQYINWNNNVAWLLYSIWRLFVEIWLVLLNVPSMTWRKYSEMSYLYFFDSTKAFEVPTLLLTTFHYNCKFSFKLLFLNCPSDLFWLPYILLKFYQKMKKSNSDWLKIF